MPKKKEETQEKSLLKELCGGDVKLYEFLGSCLYLNPLTAISENSLDILTAEAEKSGDFRPAIDKAIFDCAQKPTERENYIRVIQTLASKAIQTRMQEKERAEKEGFVDQAASLKKKIENQKFMSERAEDIINVASKYYNERLIELGENAKREARVKERTQADMQEIRTEQIEEAGREARKKERSGMGKEEKRESEKQDKRDELVAGKRKEEIEKEGKEAKKQEKQIAEQEKAGREARKKERSGN
jgi:hypothetical protein